MSKKDKYILAVAEQSPVIAAGLAMVLRRMNHLSLNIIEIYSRSDLKKNLNLNKLDILLINPTFGGVFDPIKCRKETVKESLKIIAIENGKLSTQTSSLYDGIININDNLEEINKVIKNIIHEEEIDKEEKESLSTREKEIVSLVVKGLTNQEIADKLFLSIHTVITHRRNIARKLEIHSATGLTIFAIVNKIVNIEDIAL